MLNVPIYQLLYELWVSLPLKNKILRIIIKIKVIWYGNKWVKFWEILEGIIDKTKSMVGSGLQSTFLQEF